MLMLVVSIQTKMQTFQQICAGAQQKFRRGWRPSETNSARRHSSYSLMTARLPISTPLTPHCLSLYPTDTRHTAFETTTGETLNCAHLGSQQYQKPVSPKHH